jgi:hypothetical protein
MNTFYRLKFYKENVDDKAVYDYKALTLPLPIDEKINRRAHLEYWECLQNPRQRHRISKHNKRLADEL